MPTLKTLVHELHRRSLWQVLTVYVAGSLGVLQAIDLLSKNIGLPDWVGPFATVLLLIGLPIVLATAFVQKGPSGAGGQATTRSTLVLPASMRDAVVRANARSAPLLTWRRAILGGVAAFGTLSFSTAGYVAMRSLGVGPVGSLRAKGVLGERAPIIVADFGSTAGDTILARAATEAFRVDLAQSTDVKVYEPRQLATVLQRMQKRPDAPIDLNLANEIATREGAAAIVAGAINPVGRGFLLSVRLLGTKDGQELASLRATARDTSAVIGAIDELSKGLREKIGESYRTLQRGQPLEQVTTASMEALRKYSQGARALDMSGDGMLGVALLEEAVALDTGFAMAYRKLGTALSNQFLERSRAVDALTRAYNHRDRMTQRERYLAEASYLTQVTWQPDQALVSFRNLLELDSMDTYALNNMGVVYGRLNDYAQSSKYYLRAVHFDSANAVAYGNGISALVNLGRIDEAKALLARFREHFPTSQRFWEFTGLLASARGDYAGAVAILGLFRDSATSSVARANADDAIAHVEATRGRLSSAEAHLRAALEEETSQKMFGSALARVTDLAGLDIYVRRSPDRALRRMEAALTLRPLASLKPLDRPYSQFASIYAAAGRPERARALLTEYDKVVSADLRSWIDRTLYEMARADIAIAENRPADALEPTHRAAQTGSCVRCEYPYRGKALELMSQPDSALIAYERYIDTPMLRSTMLFDRWHLAAVLERMAALYEQRGETEKAAAAYNRLIQLWENADPELQPRVQTARTRLAGIIARRG